MPGIAALVNQTVEKEQSVFMFFNTSTNNLGLGLMSGKSKSQDPRIFYDDQTATAQSGDITLPSPLGAAYVNGVNVVVGFTKSGTATPATYVDIAMVSPVYQTLASAPLQFHNGIAISSSGGTPDDTGDAWLYYLTMNAADSTLAELNEYNISTFSPNAILQFPPIAANSQLAAYYVDDKNRYLIYQAKDNTLAEYECNTGNMLTLGSVTGVTPGSSLAVCRSSDLTKVCLYYTTTTANGELKIFRVTKVNGQWGGPVPIDESPPDQSSQLAVVSANAENHLFYLPAGASGNHFAHIVDPQ